jgi:N-acetylated-alpha-linked acidic dipeptidase
MAFGAGGSAGTSYHTIYDTLAWYRKVVGEDYEPALMIARMTTGAVARLAGDRILPLDPGAYGSEINRHLALLSRRAVDLGFFKPTDLDASGIAARFAPLASAATTLARVASAAVAIVSPAQASGVADVAAQKLNAALIRSERAWLAPTGLPGRPWFRNVYASPDRDSGYASWTLPALCAAIEDKSEPALAEAERLTLEAIERQIAALAAVVPRTP